MADHAQQAVAISTTLSQTIMTAGVAVVTVLGIAYITLVPQMPRSGKAYRFGIAVLILTEMVLIASVMCGGKGVALAYREGAVGNWSVDIPSGWYSAQAWLTFIGLVLSALLGVFWAIQVAREKAHGPPGVKPGETCIKPVETCIKDVDGVKVLTMTIDVRLE